MSLHRPFVVALLVVLTGCGAMRPTQPPAALTCNLTNYEAKDIYEQWRTYRATMSRPRALQDQRPSFNVLSLSAGGEFGAYGAGFLVGWDSAGSQAVPGPRRDIQVVTGVSTGAILATHVFLGLDKEIETAYRSLSGKQIYRSRELFEYLRANS